MRAFVCSRDDVVTRVDWDVTSTRAEAVLESVPVRCVAANGDRVIVGTRGAGVFLNSDGGEGWERMELPERDLPSLHVGFAFAIAAARLPPRCGRARPGLCLAL